MTTKTRAPRVAELASDEGYNLKGAPVLLAKLTAYVSRPLFAQLAAIATAAGGEYSKHNQAFQFTDPAARESFAAQARVILSNPAPAPEAPRTATQARAQSHRAARAAQSTAEARQFAAGLAAAQDKPMPAFTISYGSTVIGSIPATPYTDAPTVETPPAVRVSTSRPIASTMTDRTPAGYGPSQPALF